jgi:hypothetical protein
LAIPAADQNQRSRPDELEAIYNHRRNMHPELIVCPSLPGEMGSLHLTHPGTAASRAAVCSMLTANFWVSSVSPTVAWIAVSF